MIDESQVKLTLTGGTGFIARGVLEACAAAGIPCRALSRSSRPAWVPPDVEWHTVASYSDTDALAAGLAGSRCLLHLADNPVRDASRNDDEARRMCASLIEAARRAGTAHVVVASSIYAREAANTKTGSYGVVKRLIERQFLSAPDLNVVILRLPPVYGPGGAGGFLVLSRLVRKGYPLPFGMATAKRAYLSRCNLASLIVTISKADDDTWSKASGAVFEPSDGKPIGTGDLVRMIAQQIGVAARLVPVPPSALRLLASIVGKKELIAGAIDELAVASPTDLEQSFGWRPVEHMPNSLAFLE